MSKRKVKLIDGEIQSFWYRGKMNPCRCGSNCFHEEYDGQHLYGVCNSCEQDIYEFEYEKEDIDKSEWKDK